MTWGGAQGFQTPIESENFIIKEMGVYGNMHTERNLTCACGLRLFIRSHSDCFVTDVEFYFSGHMTPRKYAFRYASNLISVFRTIEFVPWAAFATVSYLLGHQDSPSSG